MTFRPYSLLRYFAIRYFSVSVYDFTLLEG